MEPTTERICLDCGKPFPSHAVSLYGQELFRQSRCNPCCAIHEAQEIERRGDDRSKKRNAEWQAVCPAIYRDTNSADRRLDRRAVALAIEWNPLSTRGLAIIGPTGQGKTRCLFLALLAAHNAGRSTQAISHNRFSRAVVDAFSGADDDRARGKAILARLASADVILLDDLGKCPSTERVDAEVEELVEHRTSESLPILWTANGSGEWLISRFGKDRGEPLVRRLGEFCSVLTL